jgi:hypothetical protein
MVLSTFPGTNKVQGKNTLGYLRITVNILAMPIVLAFYLNDNKLNPLSCISDFLCVCSRHLLFILPGTNIYIHVLDITLISVFDNHRYKMFH